jgi:hypothetical protein
MRLRKPTAHHSDLSVTILSVSNIAQSSSVHQPYINRILLATRKTGFLSSGSLPPHSLPRSLQDTRRTPNDTPSNSSPLPSVQIGSRTPYSMDSGGGGSQRVKRLGQELTTHIHLESTVRMIGSIPPLPYAFNFISHRSFSITDPSSYRWTLLISNQCWN